VGAKLSRSFEKQSALSLCRAKAPEASLAPGAAILLLGEILDLRPFPALVLRPDMTVAFSTRMAQAALARDGVAVSAQGSLRFAEPGAEQRLAKALKSMAAERQTREGRVLALDLADGSQRFLTIEVFRLPGACAFEPCGGGLFFLVSFRKSLRSPKIEAERIAAALGLTAAEANLAAALAAGFSLSAYAKGAGLKITTVRWHLQNIFNRTGTRSQADLVSMVVSLFG
jgi:DNA-binding CsgD family transcriptional regulator